MNPKLRNQISSLKFGDLIEVMWLDASEQWGEVVEHDSPVNSFGIFFGIRGKRTQHLVLVKEVETEKGAYHYNNIPIGMIENIRVFSKNVLRPKVKKILRKLFQKHRLKKKDGWIYADF